MHRKHADVEHERHLASFSDRVVAFSIDVALFVAGYFLTLKAIFPDYAALVNPHQRTWTALWTVLFLGYQGYASGEGRASLGKSLMRLRVVDTDGRPLSLGSSAVRSVSYLLSSVLNLGFLWTFFNPARQGWHDMVVGSVVVEHGRRGARWRFASRAAASGLAALVAGLWYWNNFAAPRYRRVMEVGYAQVGLEELKQLERLYHLKHGKYANNLLDLAPLTGAPQVFMTDMAALFDPKLGVDIRTTNTGYQIVAHAVDPERTLVAFNGP